MADLDDEHYQFVITDLIHNTVIAYTDAQPAMLADECLGAGWTRLDAQILGCALDASRYLAVQLAQLPQSGRPEP